MEVQRCTNSAITNPHKPIAINSYLPYHYTHSDWMVTVGRGFSLPHNPLVVGSIPACPNLHNLLQERTTGTIINYWFKNGVKMQKTITTKPEIMLVGISVRTNYEQELDKMKGKIFPCIQRYFHEKLFEIIPNRTNPDTTFCAYTNYDSNYQGAYTYFIGEEVALRTPPLPEGFQQLIIPSQKYVNLTTAPAPMPEVIVNAWKDIWKMSSVELGGNRRYHTDFEIYDDRAKDHQNIVLDIWIGLE